MYISIYTNVFIYIQADTLFFLLMFCMFRYSYDKIYTNGYLNRDIVVYLKYDVKFTYRKLMSILAV